jgi:heterodisulfide reductase subunit A2
MLSTLRNSSFPVPPIAEEITEMIKEKGLNRVIVAACSPRTLEPLFRDTLREAGLINIIIEMANIREHAPGFTPKKRKKPRKRQRISSACP